MDFYKIGSISKEESLMKFIDDGEIGYECFILDNEEEHYIIDILKLCLCEIGKSNLFEFLSYCCRELLNNAKKSNTKRAYFEDIKLDINNKEDYKIGMKDFKNILLNKSPEYLTIQEKKGYYVRTAFKIEDDNFIITISTNSKMVEEEITVINDRRERAKTFNSIEDALQIILQNEEGAGLGIIISLLMLKKLGLLSDSYKIETRGNETVSSITIPLSLMSEEQTNYINELFQKEIDELPHFPEHIMDLQNKISDPNVDIKNISLTISRDPGLTAEILKFSNSALFSLPKKVSSLTEAIKIVGLRGLRNLIYSYQTKNIFTKRYDMNKMQFLWDHSYKVAFYAFYLAKKYNVKEALEDVYIGGILHDLGKILTFSINPDVVSKMNFLCQEKGISIKIIEEISSGYNHSLIGAAIAEKWNFPEKFINAIKNHHAPELVDDKMKTYVYCIYFANFISNETENYDKSFNLIDKGVLSFFKIDGVEDYKNLVKQISEIFDKQNNKT